MVNTDYICAIKESNNDIIFEKVAIPTSPELVATLEGMVTNKSVTVLDMQAHMGCAFPPASRQYINYLSPFSYLDSYVSGISYPVSLTLDEYNELLAEKERKLQTDYDSRFDSLRRSDPVRFQGERSRITNNGLGDYVQNLKASYLRAAKRYINAYSYKTTLSQLKEQGNIRMYSTDTVGWSEFEYQITNEVKISVSTNFGYGSSAYFILGMSYKGIDILPYSYLVKYYYANMRDLVRYTRRYEVVRSSWEVAFDYVEKASNMANKDAEQFVRTYVMEEVNQMLYGLKAILLDSTQYAEQLVRKADEECDSDYLTVRNMDQYEKRTYEVYPEEMSMVIKSEKVTGALDFLENLLKLSVFIPEITDAVKQIRDLSLALSPELGSYINKLNEQIDHLDNRIAEAKEAISEIEARLAPHEKEIDALYEAAKAENAENECIFRSTFQQQYIQEHPEYQEFKDELGALMSPYYKLVEERSMRNSFRNSLQECQRKIITDEERMAA